LSAHGAAIAELGGYACVWALRLGHAP